MSTGSLMHAPSRFSNLTLRQKILTGYFFVILFCLFVGGIGWLGAQRLAVAVEEGAVSHLPAIQATCAIRQSFLAIKEAEKVLLNPSVAVSVRRVLQESIATHTDRINRSIALYQRLPLAAQAPPEDFLFSWQRLLTSIDIFLALSERINTVEINNPPQLALEAERHFGEFRNWAAQSSRAILEETDFRGNLDVERSQLYSWLTSLRLSNPAMKEVRNDFLEQIGGIYRHMAEIAGFLSIEEYALAKDVYVAEVLPGVYAMRDVLGRFLAPIEEVLAWYGEMGRLEQEDISPAIIACEKDLDVLAGTADQLA